MCHNNRSDHLFNNLCIVAHPLAPPAHFTHLLPASGRALRRPTLPAPFLTLTKWLPQKVSIYWDLLRSNMRYRFSSDDQAHFIIWIRRKKPSYLSVELNCKFMFCVFWSCVFLSAILPYSCQAYIFIHRWTQTVTYGKATARHYINDLQFMQVHTVQNNMIRWDQQSSCWIYSDFILLRTKIKQFVVCFQDPLATQPWEKALCNKASN